MAVVASHFRTPVVIATVTTNPAADFPVAQIQLGTFLFLTVTGTLYQLVLNNAGTRVWTLIGGATNSRLPSPMLFSGGITMDAANTVSGYLANDTGLTTASAPIGYPAYSSLPMGGLTIAVASLLVRVRVAPVIISTATTVTLYVEGSPTALIATIPTLPAVGSTFFGVDGPITIPSSSTGPSIDLFISNTAGGAGATLGVSARIDFTVT